MKPLFYVLLLLVVNNFSFAQQTKDTIISSTKTDTFTQNIDTTIYTIVDSVASFPGGLPAWVKYLQKNLNADVGAMNGAKNGTYKVLIEFTVTKDGILKDFVPMTNYKHGFEDEVIRILKLSPKWLPAKKNGIIVNSRAKQAQVFMLSSQ